MERDNPAERLLNILEAGRRVAPGETARAAWQAVFGMKEPNDALLVSRVGKAMSLPTEAASLMDREFPSHKQATNHWRTQATAFFSTFNLKGSWDLSSHFDHHSFLHLRSAADLLAHRVGRGADSAELAEWREEISSLAGEVLNSDIEDNVRVTVHRHLVEIIKALDEYQLTGGDAIRFAVDATIGHAVANPEYTSEISKSSVGAKFWTVVKRVSIGLSIADHAPEAIKWVEKAFEALKHVQ